MLFPPVRILLLCTVLTLAVTLVGCGGSEGDSSMSTSTSSESQYDGTFTATIGERSYDVSVRCIENPENPFLFKSDRSDYTDGNGDGYVISGMRNDDKLIFTVIDHDTTWSTPNLGEWDQEGETISGAGRVYEDGGENRTRDASFTVEC